MSGWKLFPDLIVRCTGFPYEIVEGLQFARAVEAARRAAGSRKNIEKLRSSGPRISRPSRALLSALKAGRPVDAAIVDEPAAFSDYNEHARAAQSADEDYESAYSREEQGVRAHLQALARDPRFTEAVASSSPPVFLDLEKGSWNSRLERQLASYVQRFGAKNETMSFFGPINYGAVRGEAETGIRLDWSGPATLAGRNTYFAAWVVNGLVHAWVREPGIAPWLILRRKAFAQPPLRSPGPETAVDAPEALLPRLVSEVDGLRSLQVLAGVLGVGLPQAHAAALLACEKGLLTHQLEIPAGTHHPLEEFGERLSGLPGETARRLVRALDALLAFLPRYSGARASEKVRLNAELAELVRREWSVGPPVHAPASAAEGQERMKSMRGEGHNFYQDRLPLREECGGDLRLTLSGERARELETRVAPALELMGEAAWRTRLGARQQLAQWMGSRSVPFWKVVSAYSARDIPRDHSVEQALVAGITDAGAREVELGTVGLPSSGSVRNIPLVCSVDLMVAARSTEAWAAGDYRLVMGDIHDTPLVWGWALQFHPERAQVEGRMRRALGSLAREIPVVTILSSRRTGLPPSEFPGPVVELGGVSARSSHWRLPMDDLFVESDGKEARLVSRSLGGEVCLYNGELDSLVHTAFALPRIRSMRVNLGPHTPRLSLGGVVFQRETWALDLEGRQQLLGAKGDRGRLQAAMAVWERLGLPETVFVKMRDERKPILVDVKSPPLIRVLCNLLEQREEALISEMLPGPEDLWLKGPLGRHTSEIRCTYLWEGQAERQG